MVDTHSFYNDAEVQGPAMQRMGQRETGHKKFAVPPQAAMQAAF